jgi:membrane protein YqaA with SNARE-associated domain
MDLSAESLAVAGLFASSFLSATLLPGNSEIVLVAVLHESPAVKWPALLVATIGNTLGGMTSYAIARFFPKPREGRAGAWLARHGPAALLLS